MVTKKIIGIILETVEKDRIVLKFIVIIFFLIRQINHRIGLNWLSGIISAIPILVEKNTTLEVRCLAGLHKAQ
ncbi:MAG: hypothetical protein BWK78_09435 [Thiotrichaceae bacterium IS1]|nr:MAG: hypothetical protein BWK78_09435 [Thiotrichaceae bacterium IS1]